MVLHVNLCIIWAESLLFLLKLSICIQSAFQSLLGIFNHYCYFTIHLMKRNDTLTQRYEFYVLVAQIISHSGLRYHTLIDQFKV